MKTAERKRDPVGEFKCYWTKDSYCSLEINQNADEIFIIGSCDPSRERYINTIKDVVENDYKMKAIFAEDLSQHNGYKAFCSNICSPIISSTLVIIDLSAPNKAITCSNCERSMEVIQQSVNVYWEYGYACGLAKRTLLLIEESQIRTMPFDGADTQVEPYNINDLREKLRKMISIKLKESFPPKKYKIVQASLPPDPIGPNDHRIQFLLDLLKYKFVDYYRDIKPEKRKEMSKLIYILGTFNPIFLEKYGKGQFRSFIVDYFNVRNIKEFILRLKEFRIAIPRKSSLIIAGDFALKVQKYMNEHHLSECVLIKEVHGEFDTEIRSHKIFPQDMSFDNEFKPALKELRIYGFIRGKSYEDQNSRTEFVVLSQAKLKRIIELYSLDYYFQQHFDLN